MINFKKRKKMQVPDALLDPGDQSLGWSRRTSSLALTRGQPRPQPVWLPLILLRSSGSDGLLETAPNTGSRSSAEAVGFYVRRAVNLTMLEVLLTWLLGAQASLGPASPKWMNLMRFCPNCTSLFYSSLLLFSLLKSF